MAHCPWTVLLRDRFVSIWFRFADIANSPAPSLKLGRIPTARRENVPPLSSQAATGVATPKRNKPKVSLFILLIRDFFFFFNFSDIIVKVSLHIKLSSLSSHNAQYSPFYLTRLTKS